MLDNGHAKIAPPVDEKPNIGTYPCLAFIIRRSRILFELFCFSSHRSN